MNAEISEIISIIEIFARSDSTITGNSKLLEDGIIDSLNVVQIISEIEATYDVKIGAMELSFDDFESPATLAAALKNI